MKRFAVWCPERGQTEADAAQLDARNAEDAAREWAGEEDANSADYLIVGQRWEPTLHVRDGDKVRAFKVTGEAVPQYDTEELDT